MERQLRCLAVGVCRRFAPRGDLDRLWAILTLKGAFGVQNARAFCELPAPASRSSYCRSQARTRCCKRRCCA